MGRKFDLKLNNGKRPIANKYREGKMQRTLKRESKVLEIVEREAVGFWPEGLSNQPGVGRPGQPMSFPTGKPPVGRWRPPTGALWQVVFPGQHGLGEYW